MRTLITGLLLSAACATPASAAVRWEIFNRRASDHRSSNATVTPAAGEVTRSSAGSISSSSTSSVSVNTMISTVLNGSQASSSILTIFNQDPTTTDSHAGSTISTSNESNLASSRSASTPLSSQLTLSVTFSTSISTTPLESNPRISSNRVDGSHSTPISNTIPASNTPEGSNSFATPSSPYSTSSSLSLWNTTRPATTANGLTSASDSESCTELADGETVTEYSIVYTSTTTLYGNYSSYTPPYPPIETPTYCDLGPKVPTASTTNAPYADSFTPGFVISTKQPASCSNGATESDCLEAPGPWGSSVPETHKGKQPSETLSVSRVTVTFVTTDKNPVVVHTTDTAPAFSESGKAASLTVDQHKSVSPDGGNTDDGGGNNDGTQNEPQSHQKQAPKTMTTSYKITARAGLVIINGKTYSNLKPDETRTVALDDGTFTIYPTEVVGEGASIQKPKPVGTAISVITPTTTSVGNLAVEVSGSEAVVDGTKIKIPPLGTTTVINNEQVSVGPGKIIVDSQTMTFRAAGGYQTAVVVEGGEMVTAIGKSIFVFHSTTLTYGPDIPETSEVVDDDTITLGPSGVVLHGTTIGGTTADPTGTMYEIVGGATITELAPSFVIIDGTTFTAGPGSEKRTKVIGGETITIGPNGIVISSMTLSIPFGSSIVTTVMATITRTSTLPVETGSSGENDRDDDNENSEDDEDSAGPALEPGLATGITGLSIAIGVWIWL